jgi:hypothetical protein
VWLTTRLARLVRTLGQHRRKLNPEMKFARWLSDRLVPIELKGYLDYYRFPERRSPWGGPFNGQNGRKAVFEAIVSLQKPNLIIETGTFLGTTSEALAGANVPVVLRRI